MHGTSGYHKNSIIWALISDGKIALVYRYRHDDGDAAEEKSLDPGKLRRVDNIAERGVRNTVEFARKTGTKAGFAHDVASALNEAYYHGKSDYFVMAVPYNMARELKAALHEDVQGCLLADMPPGFDYDGGKSVLTLKKDIREPKSVDSAVFVAVRGCKNKVWYRRDASQDASRDFVRYCGVVQ
jgi:hypothetical protein